MDVPRPQRTWTRRAAEAVLPDIEVMLKATKSVVAQRQKAQEHLEDLRIVWGDQLDLPDCPAHQEFRRYVREFQDAQSRLRQVVEAFFEQGVEVSDPDEGRVDFLSRSIGHLTFLCYHRGEAALRHWHELDETCEDRRSIPEAANAR